MDQNYRDETRVHHGNGQVQNSRSQWDHWDGWNPNPCIDTSRNYTDWNRSNHTGILKQHTQELHNFGSSASINNDAHLDNHNRYEYGMDSSRYRRITEEESSSNNIHRYFDKKKYKA